MTLKLKEWACDQIAEAFRDHLEGDYYCGSEIVEIKIPESEITYKIEVMIIADIMWKSFDAPDGRSFKLRNMVIRDLSIDFIEDGLDALFGPNISIDGTKSDLTKSFIKLFS